jgi:hypothetical protein
MAQYDVYVFCNSCGDVHRMGIRIAMNDGPARKESIGDLYAGKELPENIGRLMNNQTTCPKTGKAFVQKDNKQVFLVPISVT